MSAPTPEPPSEPHTVPQFCPFCDVETARTTGLHWSRWECPSCGRSWEIQE
jgi:transposase-like protein